MIRLAVMGGTFNASTLALSACTGDPIAADKRDYAGSWQAAGLSLMISPDVAVARER
jgi:hypothetical protein